MILGSDVVPDGAVPYPIGGAADQWGLSYRLRDRDAIGQTFRVRKISARLDTLGAGNSNPVRLQAHLMSPNPMTNGFLDSDYDPMTAKVSRVIEVAPGTAAAWVDFPFDEAVYLGPTPGLYAFYINTVDDDNPNAVRLIYAPASDPLPDIVLGDGLTVTISLLFSPEIHQLGYFFLMQGSGFEPHGRYAVVSADSRTGIPDVSIGSPGWQQSGPEGQPFYTWASYNPDVADNGVLTYGGAGGTVVFPPITVGVFHFDVAGAIDGVIVPLTELGPSDFLDQGGVSHHISLGYISVDEPVRIYDGSTHGAYLTGPHEPKRPEEWMTLPRDGEPGLIEVEWDPVTDRVRKTAPVVRGRRPTRPAP